MSLDVGSQFRLHGVESFDEEALVAHGTGGALPVPMLVEVSRGWKSTPLLVTRV
jgi:hypothetical protein